jgi:alpha-galactosidase
MPAVLRLHNLQVDEIGDLWYAANGQYQTTTMTKIAFIGAGSFGFTRTLVKDILTFPLLEDATLADGHRRRAPRLYQACRGPHCRREGNYPAKVEATMDRAEALKGADAVICTILAGGVTSGAMTSRSPKSTASTPTWATPAAPRASSAPCAPSRDARHLPRHGKVLPRRHFAELYQPDGHALPGHAARDECIKVSGLCHSVQGTAHMLAAGSARPTTRSATPLPGINHQAWYVKFEWNGKDAYPLIRRPWSGPRSITKSRCATRCSCTWATMSPSRAGTTRSTTGGSASART